MIFGNSQLGGPILGSLCTGSYYLGSRIGAPDFWKLSVDFCSISLSKPMGELEAFLAFLLSLKKQVEPFIPWWLENGEPLLGTIKDARKIW